MKKIILVLLAFCYLIFLSSQRCADVRKKTYNGNKGKCIEKKTGEENYSSIYARKIKNARGIKAETEVPVPFTSEAGESTYVCIDLVIGDYVIEAGLDKRSSLDSVQQAIFFSIVTKKKPAVVIYDTDKKEGIYEYRIRKAIEKINEETEKVGKAKIIEYCWVKATNKYRVSGINRLSEDDCPWERKPKKKKK